MLGSVVRVTAAVGEADDVGAGVDVEEELVLFEADALGLRSPPHPASSMVAASGMASSAADVFFPVPDFTMSPTAIRTERAITALGKARTTAREGIPQHDPQRAVCRTREALQDLVHSHEIWGAVAEPKPIPRLRLRKF
jgi:hypothetical protein